MKPRFVNILLKAVNKIGILSWVPIESWNRENWRHLGAVYFSNKSIQEKENIPETMVERVVVQVTEKNYFS